MILRFMLKKIRKRISFLSKNIVIKCHAYQEKLKDFFSPAFDPENKEKGLVPLLVGLAILGIGALLVGSAAATPIGNAVAEVAKTLATNVLGAILVGLSNLAYTVAKALSLIAVTMLDKMLNVESLARPITQNAAFIAGWTNVRNLANMIIVLGFVVVGIATALRFKDYEAKKLLAPLIIVALLVNFSGLLCGLIIDGSNIIMKTFLDAGGNGVGLTIWKSIDASVGRIDWQRYLDNGDWYQYAFQTTGFTVMFATIAVVVFYLDFILLARYAVLAVLFILSPLAFVSWVFPASKKLWSMWWENFLKWAFIGAAGGFFVWCGAKMLDTLGNKLTDYDLVVVLIFLYVGFKVTKHSGAMGASAVVGFAGTVAGYGKKVGGAVGKAGLGSLDKLSGGRGRSAIQKVSGGLGRAAEALGWRKEGSTAAKRGEAMKEPQNRMNALIAEGNISHVQRVAKGEGMGRNSAERAGATAALLKSGNFDMNDAKQVAGLANFQSQGGDLSEYTKKDPRLAYHDISAARKTMAENPGMSEEQARVKNVASAYAKLGPRNIGDLSPGAIDENFFMNVKPRTIAKADDLGNFTDKQIEQIQKHLTPGTDEHRKLQGLLNKLKASDNPKDIADATKTRDNIRAAGKIS